MRENDDSPFFLKNFFTSLRTDIYLHKHTILQNSLKEVSFLLKIGTFSV
jgi:hypothetical protein